ncbi:MAG TPA: type 1 glutamine amidotransferase domain-containing protein [Legionella sp.]|nr:type 1 glutamine amidotransferase domain-containing protein [Legionella sp.]
MENLNGLKVGILVANGFEQIELEEPRKALEKAGAKTFIISPEQDKVQGWNHAEKGDFFSIDYPLDTVESEDFDALLLPGGLMNPDKLRILPKAVSLVKKINQQNKPIAAICHAPWLLINAGLARGRKMTSYSSVATDLVNAGAEWVDAPVVRDHQIVTSRKPDDIPQFNEAMINLFANKSGSS